MIANVLHLAVADLVYDRWRAALAVSGLGVLLFVYYLLSALSGIFTEFSTTPGVSNNLMVIQSDFVDPGDAVLDLTALAAARKLEPDPAARVSPFIFRHMRLQDRMILLRAAPLRDWQPVFHLALVSGRWPEGGNEVVVGEGAARGASWQPGAQIEIFSRPFVVTGVVRSPGAGFASVWMADDIALALFGPRQAYQGMYVQAAPGTDLENLRMRLQAEPALRPYTVFYEDSYTYRNNQAMRDFAGLARLGGFLSLLAVCFGAYTSAGLSLAERARETGILRAVGFSNHAVLAVQMTRSALLALAAWAAGLLAAVFFTLYRQAAAPELILGVPLVFKIGLTDILTGAALAAGLGTSGAWLACRGLLKGSPAGLLRGESGG